jgi:glycerol-3-phosphate acyltransferase PlsY
MIDSVPLPLLYVAVGAAAYLLGSLPFGVLLTRAAGVGDVRNIGSGNIGATNVLRTGRKDLALLTLLLDAGKGAGAVLLTRALLGDAAREAGLDALAGAAAFLGHLFPVWLRFKGGKGVATFLGVLFGLAWPVGLLAAVTWLGAALSTRFSSVGAIAAAALASTYAALMNQPRAVIACIVLMGVLVLIRHRGNIARLRRGEEPRIGARSEP